MSKDIDGTQNAVYCNKPFQSLLAYARNPLDTFPRSFPVDGEVANLLRTCYGETGVMDFGLYTAHEFKFTKNFYMTENFEISIQQFIVHVFCREIS